MVMSPRLTRDEVAHVARLARLRLSEAELEEFTEQLADVLEHADDIERLDADDVEPTAHPLPLRNVFRPDVVTPSIDRGRGPRGCPRDEDGQFRVPQILGEEQ